MKSVTADKLPNMHSTDFRGIPVVIQWPKGSVRVGENSKGEPFKIEMKADYGYIPSTVDIDRDDHTDVYIGSHKDSEYAYVLEQMQNGEFDEYKVMLGYESLEEAEQSYLEHLPEEMLGEIHEVPFDELFETFNKEKPETEAAEEEVHEERVEKHKRSGENNVSVVEAFVKLYKHEFEYFDKVAEEVHDQLAEALNDAGIRAIVTYRAKKPRKLKGKLLKRDKTKGYLSFQDIYDDVVDLAGVRVALYLPHDRTAVGEIIEGLFTQMRVPKNFPEDKAPDDAIGYVATHYLVRLKPETLHKDEYQYADTNVEIQVASVLMHAWAEVTHDLLYKPEKGTLTPEEVAMIQDLNRVVQEGESVLENLQQSVEGRRNEDFFELAASLAKRLGTQSRGHAMRRITAGDVKAVARKIGMKYKSVKYRGQVLKENPLTGDWLVDLGDPYGAYAGDLKRMKVIVDRYHEHKKSTKSKPHVSYLQARLALWKAYGKPL